MHVDIILVFFCVSGFDEKLVIEDFIRLEPVDEVWPAAEGVRVVLVGEKLQLFV